MCSGRTGHTEVVLVVFDPAEVTYDELLRTFWENHDPTQGMRQGNDVGTQYRSAIYTYAPEQLAAAEASAEALRRAARRAPATARSPPRSPTAPTFYWAEDYHQQYLAKNPNGLLRHRRHRRELPRRPGRRLRRRPVSCTPSGV